MDLIVFGYFIQLNLLLQNSGLDLLVILTVSQFFNFERHRQKDYNLFNYATSTEYFDGVYTMPDAKATSRPLRSNGR